MFTFFQGKMMNKNMLCVYTVFFEINKAVALGEITYRPR